ncbi:MAG: glycosidase [Porphyromonadaceae bacterium CG2_30_38_12]|nr:MAG: glycosidase [Porphyromonadaceae bacterium CG2_30_38_12]
MKKVFITFVFLVMLHAVQGQTDKVSVMNNNDGLWLSVNGNSFTINGMNWDYFPIGTNFTYSLWTQPDAFIKTALDREMGMLKNMGVNTIRAYTGIQPKWITYIYENYGIWTVVNHSFGRYGLTIDGVWTPNTEYGDSRTQELLMKEVTDMAEMYKGTPGLLTYLLGNENNYGLFWSGAETEDIPIEKRESTHRAKALYKVFNDAVKKMKTIDSSRPIAICNGDMLFIDIIADECKDMDILGINCYRGMSFGDLFDKAKAKVNVPIMFTEFGADAYNAVTNQEDQASQARFLISNWKEIYANGAGYGKANNCIGGFTFQFSDGWWKYGQTLNLDVHDTHASWINGGYLDDYVPKENNMNEEWYGICAKGQTDTKGHYQLYPRAAYYALQKVHHFNSVQKSKSIASLTNYFSTIEVTDNVLKARADKAALFTEIAEKVRISGVRAEISTFTTGGSMITTPTVKNENLTTPTYPSKLGFDRMESYYIGVEAKPTENVQANVTFNILGNVAENPIDEIFYENRGAMQMIKTTDPTNNLSLSNNRIQLYQADFKWDDKWFSLLGFYRTGHNHWGYDGDFFGLYPEAHYGPNMDIYNGEAPFGFEVTGKKSLGGLTLAFGPELWWGANPALLAKYNWKIGKFGFTGIYHEDVDKRTASVSSFAIPTPQNRRATLEVKTKLGGLGISAGGIWSGSRRIGDVFQLVEGTTGNYTVYQDKIKSQDTWGGKMKLTYTQGAINWYGQGAIQGLVASGGSDYTVTYTGWRLKDSGSGNQYNFLTGLTYKIGNLEIAPNFLWQKPIVGPVPMDAPAPGRPRNILDDPFAVRANRETTAGELLFAYDPTPATRYWDWDNDEMEDAKFAMSADFVYRHQPTTQDASIGKLANRATFAFAGAPTAHDLWEVNSRIVSKINHDFGLIANIFAGTAQSNGSDERLITRFGGDVRMIYKKVKLISTAKVNDWGPYDYHHDFNLTYPLQLMADVSTSIAKQKWFIVPETRLGIRATWRSLDQYSPRYAPTYITNAAGALVADPLAVGYGNGNEWEIRTYIHFNIGK